MFYYHADQLGDVIALTDASGQVTDQYLYTPFGIEKGTATHPSGVEGFSAQSAPAASVRDLYVSGNMGGRNTVGVTTVGDVRAADGDAIPTSGAGNHVTVTGLEPDTASGLFDEIPNPMKD